MLRKVRTSKAEARPGQRFVVVASLYNRRYVDGMLRAAVQTLRQAGVQRVEVIRVPGAFEIPIVASTLARNATGRPSAIICLGVIMRGETVHADYIGETVSRALMQIQLAHGVPVVHEVLLLENHAQARARCLDKQHNRGIEAALTAIRMANLMDELTASP